MNRLHATLVILNLIVGTELTQNSLCAQSNREPISRGAPVSSASQGTSQSGSSLPVSLDAVPKPLREAIIKIVQNPTISTSSKPGAFLGNEKLYLWMLDHPDRVGLAWRRMGIPAVDIQRAEGGKFIWKDEQGSELVWVSVAQNQSGRVWYAEGNIRPGALMPMIPVRVVGILKHEALVDREGKRYIRHSVEGYIHMESKFAAMVTKLLGTAAPQLAEQGAEQLLYYFSGVSRYLHAHPEKTQTLLGPPNHK